MKNRIKYAINSTKEMAKKSSGGGTGYWITILDMVWCGLRYQASPRNYYWFGFYELKGKQRRTFVTHGMSERIQKRCNETSATVVFRNKMQFYSYFSAYMNRKVCLTNEKLSSEEIRSLGRKIIFKPLEGSQGFGIRVIEPDNYTDTELLSEIRRLPKGVLEEWIIQHDDMNQFCASAVNIIRVVTGRKNEDFRMLASTLAVAKEKEYANASGDAIFANVDVNSGMVISDGCDYDEVIYEEHPITKVKFKGFRIPYWNRIYQMLREATTVMTNVGYVGWDIAITPNGPVIIEGNNDPGYEWMQLRMINPSGIGKKKEYEFLLK